MFHSYDRETYDREISSFMLGVRLTLNYLRKHGVDGDLLERTGNGFLWAKNIHTAHSPTQDIDTLVKVIEKELLGVTPC